MQKKYIIISVIALLFIGLGLFFLFGGKSAGRNTATATTTPNTESATTQTKTYSAQEIAIHNKGTDCWTIVNKKVYDITSYVPRHPGGAEILRACGADGTSLFTTRTTTSGEKVGSGTPHSDSAADQLARMQIGVLAQ
jgi:hypothetical protein